MDLKELFETNLHEVLDVNFRNGFSLIIHVLVLANNSLDHSYYYLYL